MPTRRPLGAPSIRIVFRAASIVALAIACTVAASCSSSDSPASRATGDRDSLGEYARAFNAVGADIRQQASELRDVTDPGVEAGELAPKSYALGMRDLLSNAAGRLDEIAVPTELSRAHAELVFALRENVAVWDEYAASLTGSDSPEALRTADTRVSENSKAAERRFTAACAALKEKVGLDGLTLDMDC